MKANENENDEYSLYGGSSGWGDDATYLDDDTRAYLRQMKEEAEEKGWLRSNGELVTGQQHTVVEIPVDADGNPLTEADIRESLSNLFVTRLNLDSDVRKIEDPEEQALTAKRLKKRYDDLEKDLKDQLRDIQKINDARFTANGVSNYGFESVESNRKVTEMMDDTVAWWEDELRALKDRLAERVRGQIDDLRAEGLDVNDRVRDAVYEDLVDEEVIEAWEPLEL